MVLALIIAIYFTPIDMARAPARYQWDLFLSYCISQVPYIVQVQWEVKSV